MIVIQTKSYAEFCGKLHGFRRFLKELFRLHFARLWLYCFLGLNAFAHCAQAAEPIAGPSAPFGLNQLIALSIQNHPSISAARAQFGAAQSEVTAAKAQYYPTPSVQVLQDKGTTAAVLTVQQPLWAGGRIDAGLDAARSRTNAAEVSISDAQRTLALRVTSAWAAWMQARGRGEALEEGVTLLNLYTESVNRRIEGGASAVVDRELVASRLAQTQGDLAAVRSAERSALGRLAQLAGQPLRSEDLAGTPIGTKTALLALDALVAQAQARSAALKRIEADIETAGYETAQKRALLWPNLSLRARHQRSDANTTGITANDSSVMLMLDYAPGAGLSASAGIAAAESRQLALRENLAAARSELIENVVADYEDYRASSDRAQSLQRTIQASAEVLASYDRLFVAGKRNWLDVINAARELIQARTLLADAQAQQAAAHARLRLHLGEMP